MIYLDYNATTPIPQEVFDAMVPFLTEQWGNPSSSYAFGSKIRNNIAEARARVSLLIGAKRGRVIFTSGATEANNAVLKSVLDHPEGHRHIVTTAVEHPSVIETCLYMQRVHGVQITFVPVHENGTLDQDAFKLALESGASLVSVMWANNETGVLFPVEELSALSHEHGVPFHTDASQVVGKLPIDISKLPIDFLTLTGHKFGAPKGIGALFCRRSAPLSPFVHGGHQEQGQRGGTESVPLIVGLGVAAQIAHRTASQFEKVVRPLRDQLEERIIAQVEGVHINGLGVPRLANTTNLSFDDIASEALLLLLDKAGICASSGSACMALSDEPSYVIAAMGGTERARAAVRFSFGIANTQLDVQQTTKKVAELTLKLRGKT